MPAVARRPTSGADGDVVVEVGGRERRTFPGSSGPGGDGRGRDVTAPGVLDGHGEEVAHLGPWWREAAHLGDLQVDDVVRDPQGVGAQQHLNRESIVSSRTKGWSVRRRMGRHSSERRGRAARCRRRGPPTARTTRAAGQCIRQPVLASATRTSPARSFARTARMRATLCLGMAPSLELELAVPLRTIAREPHRQPSALERGAEPSWEVLHELYRTLSRVPRAGWRLTDEQIAAVRDQLYARSRRRGGELPPACGSSPNDEET